MKKSFLCFVIFIVCFVSGCNYSFRCDIYNSSTDEYTGEAVVSHAEDEGEAEDACEDEAGSGYYCTNCQEE